jgi:glycosyltransferase involved in cell wall biosynthesis
VVDLHISSMETEPEKYRILTCYYRPKPGGLCKRLFRAINALLERGHIVHYLAVVPFPIDHPNIHFHRFPWSQSHTQGLMFWCIFHLIAPLQLLYLGYKYRINRLFAFGNNYALFLQPLHIVKRIPLTLFLRADTLENHKLNKRSRWLRTLEHIIEGLALFHVRLYGVSSSLTEKVVDRHHFFRPLHARTLKNDIQPAKIAVVKTENISLPLRLGCVGVLEPRKNQRFLLELMKSINKDQAILFIYGSGPDESTLKNMAEQENLTDRVHFMGWVETTDIWINIDILLMPSLHEGAPNAVLEALASGIPVLASDIPEHREILPECSLFSINHLESWINMINQDKYNLLEKLSDIKLSQSVGAENLNFDWDQIVSETILPVIP